MDLPITKFTGGFAGGPSSRETVFDKFMAAAIASGKTPALAVEVASQAIEERARYFALCEEKARQDDRAKNEEREAGRKTVLAAGGSSHGYGSPRSDGS